MSVYCITFFLFISSYSYLSTHFQSCYLKISHFGGFLTLLKIFLVFILLYTYRSINITLFERYEFFLMTFDFYHHVLSLSCLILDHSWWSFKYSFSLHLFAAVCPTALSQTSFLVLLFLLLILLVWHRLALEFFQNPYLGNVHP